jgi:glycosyltransferase involved in cell wall biosynthesis
MAATWQQATIACLPSYAEGLPKVLIEAAACGLPAVTTDVPGCREAVTHKVNGLLVPPRDAQALAAALRRLLDDPALRARLAAAGRQRAEAEFGERAIAAQTLAVYEELLAQ